jgi:Flp pilus assembly protein CpaB
VKMNTDAVPPSAFTNSDAVVGQITLAPISLGEPVLPSRLAGANGTPFVVIPSDQLGPTGAPNPGSQHYRAMSITVADAQAAGGNILAGDMVDVLFSFKFDPSLLLRNPNPTVNNADVSARIVLERVPILARNLSVYTIRTDAATAERIGWMTASGGQLQLLLRGPRDDRATGTTGATFSRVYPDWRIPVPEKITP